MLGRLIPRDQEFFTLFNELAAHLGTAARLLCELFDNPARLQEQVRAIKEVEHKADQLTVEINVRIDQSFVTPIDREDISVLISRIDDIVDLIEEVADTCILYGIDEPTPVAIQQTEIIVKQCEQLQGAIDNLHDFKDLAQYWIEVHRLENEGDRIVRHAIAELFNNGTNAVDIIKWKDVYSLLEEAIDACEDAANVIERIVVKHA